MRIPVKPVQKTFTISSPLYGEATITIRQARTGENIQRADLVAETSYVINDKVLEQEIRQKFNWQAMRRFDVFMTLVDCSIEVEDEAGNSVGPWFTFVNGRLQDRVAFEKAYNALPPEISDAIYNKVLEVNPQWARVNEDEEGEFLAT